MMSMHPISRVRGSRLISARASAAWIVISAATLSPFFSPGSASAQTDYYNLDRDRPVRLEDASALERHAFELKVASLRLERGSGGVYHWEFEPELAYGILPRTSIGVAVPFAFVDQGGERRHGVSGVELSVFHNFNVESVTLPALALRTDVRLPLGGLAPERTYTSFTGIATRTIRRVRLHVNAAYAVGSADESEPDEGTPGIAAELPARWLAGVALDRAFPLQSVLVIGGVYASEAMHGGEPVRWNAETGVRLQVSPTFAMDAGVGRGFGKNTWYATAGGALHFALRRLMPVAR